MVFKEGSEASNQGAPQEEGQNRREDKEGVRPRVEIMSRHITDYQVEDRFKNNEFHGRVVEVKRAGNANLGTITVELDDQESASEPAAQKEAGPKLEWLKSTNVFKYEPGQRYDDDENNIHGFVKGRNFTEGLIQVQYDDRE